MSGVIIENKMARFFMAHGVMIRSVTQFLCDTAVDLLDTGIL